MHYIHLITNINTSSLFTYVYHMYININIFECIYIYILDVNVTEAWRGSGEAFLSSLSMYECLYSVYMCK